MRRSNVPREDKPFVLAGKTFKSRLIIGTGKYKTYADNAARAGGQRARRSSPWRCAG